MAFLLEYREVEENHAQNHDDRENDPDDVHDTPCFFMEEHPRSILYLNDAARVEASFC